MKCLRPLTQRERCRIRKKNNRSGISGVTRIDALEKHRGKVRHRLFWLAQWPTGQGKAKMKKFSISEREAFQRAVRARREALKRLAEGA